MRQPHTVRPLWQVFCLHFSPRHHPRNNQRIRSGIQRTLHLDQTRLQGEFVGRDSSPQTDDCVDAEDAATVPVIRQTGALRPRSDAIATDAKVAVQRPDSPHHSEAEGEPTTRHSDVIPGRRRTRVATDVHHGRTQLPWRGTDAAPDAGGEVGTERRARCIISQEVGASRDFKTQGRLRGSDARGEDEEECSETGTRRVQSALRKGVPVACPRKLAPRLTLF